LTFINIAIQLLGRVYVDQGHYLGCDKGGTEWIYTSIWGSLFVTAHMVLIIMQAVMLEKALYGVPHHSGWFELPNDLCDNIGNDDDSDVKSVEQGNGEYTAAPSNSVV